MNQPASHGADPQVSQQLVQSCQGIVRNIAFQIHQKLGRRVDLDDLISYGQVGLAEAATRFDSTRGNEFVTYAYYRIRGAIYDAISREPWFRRDVYYQNIYQVTSDDLLEDAGEKPEPDDARTSARQFSTLSERLALAYVMTRLSAERQDAQPSESVFMERELAAKLHQLIDNLPDQERLIIQAVYFDGITLAQISKTWKLSKGWASRLHARALQRLGRLLRQIGAN